MNLFRLKSSLLFSTKSVKVTAINDNNTIASFGKATESKVEHWTNKANFCKQTRLGGKLFRNDYSIVTIMEIFHN